MDTLAALFVGFKLLQAAQMLNLSAFRALGKTYALGAHFERDSIPTDGRRVRRV